MLHCYRKSQFTEITDVFHIDNWTIPNSITGAFEMHFDDVEGEELFRRRFLFVLSFFASDYYFKDNFNGIIKEDWSITEDKPSYSASMFQKVGLAVYKCQWTENVSADASDGKFRLFLLSNDLQTKWATRCSVVELINLWRP